MVDALGAWIEIDLSALVANYGTLRERAPGCRFLASVKGNAYGHDAVAVANALESQGVEAFMVASILEGQTLRTAGIRAPIVCFSGQYPVDYELYLGQAIIPTICSFQEAEALARAAPRQTPVWVEVDSGFGRFGVELNLLEQFILGISKLPQLSVEGVYTHLPFTDEQGKAWAEKRAELFSRAVQSLQGRGLSIPIVQALSSAGVIAGLGAGTSNAVCVGHALYGLRTFPESAAGLRPLRPVLSSLKARLSHVSAHDRTAVVPLGLAHGFVTRFARSGAVLLRGRKAPVVRVSTANMTIDVSACGAASVGDEVVLLGSQGGAAITLEDVAKWSVLTPLECLMAWNQRLPCVFQR